jgi:hypothetical protein
MKLFSSFFFFFFFVAHVFAQKGESQVKMIQSEDFESPGRHEILAPIPFGEKGILQVNNKGIKSFNFQLFTNDLKFVKEKTVEPEDKLSEHANSPRFVKVGDKTYLFVRDVYRDRDKEGVSCLEFNFDKLNFEPKDKKLFESSDKVASNSSYFSMFAWGFMNRPAPDLDADDGITFGAYTMHISKNEKVVSFTYRLKPENRNDKLSKDVIGMQVFDQDMNKIWGDEMRMPYTEAKMDNLSSIVSDDAKVYMLTKVYEGETPSEKRDKKIPNYHLELLIYEKGKETPDIIQIKLDNLVPKSAYLFETEKGEILLGGFYAKSLRKPTDGAFVLQLDKTDKTTSVLNGGLFEIPSDLIKAFSTSREVRRLERKENKDDEGDIGVDNLIIRSIHVLENGTIFLTAEEYYVVMTTNTTTNGIGGTSRQVNYDTYANDIYVIAATPDGKSWVRKIPKSQHSNDASGRELSFNSIFAKNKLYFFYTDNKKNLNLEKDEAPKTHQQGRGGYLSCVSYDLNGDMQKHLLGEIDEFETNFFIRRFVEGDYNNLIYTARKRRKNSVISISIK